ncbi:auxin-induced protein IAA6 [Apium graveolens]|uniref:auxin-induced protein IAA6 n=1 Tax=Apium graveolens TaxID=4045 RepID=UPI003D7BFBEB
MATPGLGLEITELRLGLPCMGVKSAEKKRAFWEIGVEENGSSSTISTDENNKKSTDTKCYTKSSANQGVVGWPPVCSYRRKNSFNGRENGSKTYVKVSMDGAPILRKIDLGSFTEYSHLTMALQKLFHCFDHKNAGEKLKDTENNEYVTIYEDKDGDWMLVGDVPWEMFTESCKRLRIMKNADAKGIGLHV